jgi:hypothetical protein
MTPEKANEERALERGNQLAFPHVGFNHNGLSKREWMATQIMCGLLSGGCPVNYAVEQTVDAVDKLLIALHTNKK